jgi:hypothetical protein
VRKKPRKGARAFSANASVSTAIIARKEHSDKVPVTARALYAFEGDCQARELTFSKGDIINVVDKDVGSGWWQGELLQRAGQLLRGWFPSNYVVELMMDGEDTTVVKAARNVSTTLPASGAPTIAASSMPSSSDVWEVTEIDDLSSDEEDSVCDLNDEQDDEPDKNAERLNRIIRFSTVLRQQDIALLNWQLAQDSFR